MEEIKQSQSVVRIRLGNSSGQNYYSTSTSISIHHEYMYKYWIFKST